MIYCHRMESSRFLVAPVFFKCFLNPMFTFLLSYLFIVKSGLLMFPATIKPLALRFSVAKVAGELCGKGHEGSWRCLLHDKVPTPPMCFLLAIFRCLRNNSLPWDLFCVYMLYICYLQLNNIYYIDIDVSILSILLYYFRFGTGCLRLPWSKYVGRALNNCFCREVKVDTPFQIILLLSISRPFNYKVQALQQWNQYDFWQISL